MHNSHKKILPGGVVESVRLSEYGVSITLPGTVDLRKRPVEELENGVPPQVLHLIFEQNSI